MSFACTLCPLCCAPCARQVEDLTQDVARAQAALDALKARWLPALLRLVARINESFSASFADIGCAGEVVLDEHDNDFDKYAIVIRWVAPRLGARACWWRMHCARAQSMLQAHKQRCSACATMPAGHLAALRPPPPLHVCSLRGCLCVTGSSSGTARSCSP